MQEGVSVQGSVSGDRCTAVESRWNNAAYMQRLRREMSRAGAPHEVAAQASPSARIRPTQYQAQRSAEREAAQQARIAAREARQQAKQQALEQINAQIDQLLAAVWAR